jgi:hypothetical protein
MSVEFLSDSEPGDAPEEQLEMPKRSRWRGGWVLAVLVAGGTVWALTVPSQAPSPRHPAAPTPTASTLADRACRGLSSCAVRAGASPAIARLARAYLPPGARLRVRTVVAASSFAEKTLFLARDIDAHADSVTVLIRVRRGGSGTQAITPDPLGVGSLLLHEVNSGFVVRLQYLAPDTVPPMIGRLRALIRDPRLTSIS